jgi:heterodisulfide reductase subunit B
MPQVPKPSYKRFKPTAKQRGAINPSVRQRLAERSGGVCERCHSARAVHAAHTVRRWKLKETTLDVLIHLCVECHIWCDNTPEGRKFLSEWNEVRE